jgi:hypothetical protein
MWAKWLGATQLAVFLGVLTVTALLGLVATVWVHRKAVLDPDYLDVALVLVLMPLLSAHGSVWLFILATPALVCLLDRWGELSRGWRVATGTSVAALVLASAGLLVPAWAAALDASGVVSVAGLAVAVCTANIRWKTLS